MYQWLVFTHLVGLVVFAMCHGVAIFSAFRIRSLRDTAAVRDQLDLASRSNQLMYIGLLLLAIGGIGAATSANLWGAAWLTWSVIVFIGVIVAMYAVGGSYYYPLRDLVVGKDGAARRRRGSAGPSARTRAAPRSCWRSAAAVSWSSSGSWRSSRPDAPAGRRVSSDRVVPPGPPKRADPRRRRTRGDAMTRTVWLLVATFALVLAACGGSGSGSSDLKGTSWTVSTIAGQPTVPTAQPTIVFGSDGLHQRLDRVQHLLRDLHRVRRQAHRLPAGDDQEGLHGRGGQRPGVGVHGARSAAPRPTPSAPMAT